MIRQQVNLYADELRRTEIKYSAQMLLKLCVVLIGVLTLATMYGRYELKAHEQSLASAKQEQEKLNSEKVQLEKIKGVKDPALEKQIAQRKKELTQKQKVTAILSKDEFGNAKGFVEHVGGLARQRVDGLWITELSLSGGGTDIRMNGITNKPSLLPVYLQRLSKEKMFSGMTFKYLSMTRNKDKKQWLDFTLQNTKPEPKRKFESGN